MPIVRTPGVVGGRARVDGHRIPVWQIVSCTRKGWDTEKLLEAFPSLTVEEIQEALRYGEDNQEEIDFDIRDNTI